MASKKTSTKELRSYKLSALCRRQLRWLRKHVGLESDTAVIQEGVSQLFLAEQAKTMEYFVPRNDGYALYIGPTQVATASRDIVAAIPEEFLSLPASKRGSLLAMLVFIQARDGKGTLSIDRDALAALHRTPRITRLK
jgi:hypothetical protein